MNFTDEAREQWDRLSEQAKSEWTENLFCQKCRCEIEVANINGSIYEGQLALFHNCPQCGNKEVRLIDVSPRNQQTIDEDFERWVKAKKAAHPELFGKKPSS
ncbi:MAG: hypothetical protein ABIK68_24410 [bacterium]